MNHKIDDYIDMLLSSEISVSDLEEAQKLLAASAELSAILDSPTVSPEEKGNVVAALFPLAVQDFMTRVAVGCDIENVSDILSGYMRVVAKKNKVARATVYCVTEPNEQQLQGIRDFVQMEENAGAVQLQIVQDESLIGGFIIQTDNKRFDRSLKSKIDQIKEKVVENARMIAYNQSQKS